uniref:Pseudouridine synthase RsuA/RluA-like domain-containing protein n=1 Tax=Trypanosoma congolense (strain IL3000) TaxID=1068625 RepID=G0UPD1_TRYCI|nr:conserved hypothetical protein [Trypanosoma congolense IL3000]
MDASHLRALEEASWQTPSARTLYSTPLFPGFPWYTVRDSPGQPQQATRRYVIPYFYTFRVFVKGRWVGRELVDVYSREHIHHSRDYYVTCLEKGRLQRLPRSRCNVRRSCMKRPHKAIAIENTEENDVNVVDEQHVLQQGDIVLHTVHRHEVPVRMGLTGIEPIVLAAVRIVEYGLLVVHKPAGLPTHASGRYFMNSCVAMMEYVLAPKRLRAWLIEEDPLLQSLVSTRHLSGEEREELVAYYLVDAEAPDAVPIERLPRPCHRLDKVTSGVLLLGVSRSAARRVGEVFMKKTRQMEDILLKKLNDERESSTIAEDKLWLPGVGVLKRYLARVHGRFPDNAKRRRFRSSLKKKKKGNETAAVCAKDANEKCRSDRGLFVVVKDFHCQGKGEVEDLNVERHLSHPGETVLLASPLQQCKFSEDQPDNESVRNECGSAPTEIFYQDAMTLCQPLQFFSSGVPSPDGDGIEGESLVHCVPFSGRMHQIRMHLSDWNHPIVGDKTYQKKDQEEDSRVLFFRADELPKYFREEFHTFDDMCWECSGELPVASLSGSGGSSVALHAWRYEIEHELLSPNAAPSQDKCLAEKQQPLGQKCSAVHPDLCCRWKESLTDEIGFVHRCGSVVVFNSPPPPWAHE